MIFQDLTPFRLVENNPIIYIDPTGKAKVCYTYQSIPSDIIQQIPASILATIQNSCFKLLGCQCCLGVYLDIGESYVDGIKVPRAIIGGICKECSF